MDDDDPAMKAYNKMKLEMEQWAPSRSPAKQIPWTDVSNYTEYDESASDDDDDDDDDDENEDQEERASRNSGDENANSLFGNSTTSRASAADTATRGEEEDEVAPLNAAGPGILRITSTSAVVLSPNKQQQTATAVAERAATPIMSNSSRKKINNRSKIVAAEANRAIMMMGDERRGLPEADMTPLGVETPAATIAASRSSYAYTTPGEMTDIAPLSLATANTAGRGLFGGSSITPRTSDSGTNTPRVIAPFRSQQYEYRRYHDSLKLFLQARRQLSDRIRMDREEAALNNQDNDVTMQENTGNDEGEGLTLEGLMLAPTSASTTTDPELWKEEISVDLEFLGALKSTCWEQRQDLSQRARREGNFWALLLELRTLGFAAMLWADDEASIRQNECIEAAYLEDKASRTDATPKQLVDELAGSKHTTILDAPLVLKRRKRVLQWLEHCMEKLVTAETKASVSMAAAASKGQEGFMSSSSTPAVPAGSRKMDKVMQSCLSLVLAGRVHDACLLLRKAGQPWMAAKLGGGAPAGAAKAIDGQRQGGSETIVEDIKVGNANRSLWKRQMWKLSAKMSTSGSRSGNGDESKVTPEEAAIHHLLANDYRNAMENPVLRTWEKGLYALMHAKWGRTEDELLHLQNNNRRKAFTPFPGTIHEQQEKDQLQATCQLKNMTEKGIVEMLAASPFVEMKGRVLSCQATGALLTGRYSLVDFLANNTQKLTTSSSLNDGQVDQDMYHLRFITHILLYLDSLGACTTPITLEGIQDLKNRALFAYVDHLSRHEDLWCFLVLYASLLPETVIMEYFPPKLVRVEGLHERKMMVEQARSFFASADLDLKVLKSVVRLLLAEGDNDFEVAAAIDDSTSETPSFSDVRKMKSIQWLCCYEEHFGDALVAANILLRKFLLANKFASAIMFVEDILSSEVVDTVLNYSLKSTVLNVDNEDAIADDERYQATIGKARAEYTAYISYLNAFRANQVWNEVVASVSATNECADEKVELMGLNESEQTIAKSMERRNLILQKREDSAVVIKAADAARRLNLNVLLHDGGWLVDFEEGDEEPASNEDSLRKIQMETLRSRLLPHTVKLLHDVCEGTAEWMWTMLLDGTPNLGASPKEVLDALDNASGSSCSLSPRYWMERALDVAEVVSSDEYLTLSAFRAAELKELMKRFSDIAVVKLMYSA